jgi:hypothetical protein
MSSGDLWPCDDCDAWIPRDDRVAEYRFHIQEDFRFECVGQRCPRCAEAYAKRLTWGSPVEAFIQIATEAMTEHYGEPVTVQWLQDGHLRFLVLVRRANVAADG